MYNSPFKADIIHSRHLYDCVARHVSPGGMYPHTDSVVPAYVAQYFFPVGPICTTYVPGMRILVQPLTASG